MTIQLGESELIGDMIRMPFLNDGYIVFPAKFAHDAIHNNKFSIFVSKGMLDENTSVLMVTTDTGTRPILMDNYDVLIKRFLKIPWRTDSIKTSEGKMYRKIAPSLKSLEQMIRAFKSS
ncbi:hypothetical protein ACFQZE_06950 [Paenibacillus sp. GCM10027627]|uniref:hypothetical protein n=1 Tax=unclassified Paenibacillus TaxID=185978 RepID=UPI003644322D